MEEKEKQKPAHELRLGRIRVTIWARKSGNSSIEYYSVPMRLFKDDEDQWNQINGYWPEDLPILTKLSEMASLWIWRKKAMDAAQIED